MRICFFNDVVFLGGGEVWVLRACRYLQSAGHSVSVVCRNRSELQFACQREGIEVYTTFEPGRTGQPFYAGLHHFLQEQRVDVLYCTVMGNFCEARVLEKLADGINAERGRDKLAIVLKSGLPPMGDLTPEYYGAGSGPSVRRLHTVAESVRRAFCAWVPSMEGFLEVFFEGIDLAAFRRNGHSRAEARERWGVRDGQTVVTCVARIVDGMKGQSVLLRAVPDLLKTHPETTCLIAGDGQDREMLEEFRDDLGLQGAVRFVGHVEDVPFLLAATDVLCHPSLNDGIPNSIVEAMAMSVPVVASSVGGIPEVVEDGVTGLLARPNDVSSLRDALHKMLGNEGERASMAERGRNRIGERFELSANLDRLAARLEEELEEFRATPARRSAPTAQKTVEPVPVMFLMNVIRTGGEETELGIVARYLDKQRFPMSVLTLWDSDETAPVVDKLNAWHIPVDRTCSLMDDEQDKVRYVVERIRGEGIGVVVTCQDARLAYRAFEHLSPDECRLIEHGGIVEDVWNAPKDRTACYVGVSRQIKEAAESLTQPPGRAISIPSMVDTDEYDAPDWADARAWTARWLKETLLEPFGLPADACVVIFVGRLDSKKRVQDLISAARKLQADCPDALFLIVGGHDAYQPHYEKELLVEARDLIEAHRVAFIGPRSDVPGLLAASDILVLPSVGEGMAHVIVEAGAAGLAVVATDDGAAKEQLENGRCGCLIEPRNVEQLTDSLRHLIQDRERRELLGNRLREKVRAEYSAEVVIKQWHAMLVDVTRDLDRRVRRRSTRPRLRMVEPDETLLFPSEIQIQTNTYCNATCAMCPHPEVKKEVSMGWMEQSLYESILAQCADEPGLHRIEPFLMNEPFTDKRMIDWIAMAKDRVPHADVTVTTNGALVTPAVSDGLIASKLDAIWFSVNGATEATYEEIMGIPHARVIENIDYLLSVKPSTLRVYVNMVETRPMEPEIRLNIENWKRRGVEAGSSPFVNRAGNVRNFVELNYMPVSARPIRVCELVFYKMYVLYNGDVVLCCMDWRRQVVLGNLYEQSIREIWQGDRYGHIRAKLVERKPSELVLCSTCSYPLT